MTTEPWRLLSEHQASWSRRLARYKLQLLLAAIFLAIVGVLVALDVVDDEGALFWAGVILIFYVLPWVLVSLLSGWRSIKNVRIFEEGLAWTAGWREHIHPWDEVREVARTTSIVQLLRPEAQLTLVFKKKERVVFDQSLSHFFPLTALVEAIVTDRLLPRYRQDLDEGGACFGPVVLTRQEIHIQGHAFAWDAIEEITVHGGGLVVTPRAYEDFTAEFADFRTIPNCLVMLRLLEEVGKSPVPAETSVFLLGRKRA